MTSSVIKLVECFALRSLQVIGIVKVDRIGEDCKNELIILEETQKHV